MSVTSSKAAPRARRLSFFGASAMTVMLLYCGVIALMLAADVWYVEWADFRAALAMPEMRSAMVLTVVTSVITTVLSVLVAVPTAYVLSRRRPRGTVLADTLIDTCIVLPPLVLGLSILVMFRMGRDWGSALQATNYLLFDSLLGSDWSVVRWAGEAIKWIGAGLQQLGAGVQWIIERFTYTRAGIVLAQFFCSAAYAVRVIKAALDEVDPRSEAVAMTLGCSRGRAFWLVTLPEIKAGIAAGAILAWARAVGLFGPVQIVAGAVENRTQVLPTAIDNQISIGDLKTAIAAALVMVAFALVVLVVFRLCTKATLFGKGRAT